MPLGWVALLVLAAATGSQSSCDVDAPTRALLCHVGSRLHESFNPCLCTHVIFPNQDYLKEAGKLKERNPKLKVLYRQNQATATSLSEGVDGLYIALDKPPSKETFPSDLKELATKLDDLGAAKRAKAKYGGNDSNDDELEIIVELPAEPKRLAKHYDIKSLAKYVSYFVVPSDNLTDSSQDGLAYHPSRLMGIDDILNADSLVDLLSSMGAEHEKLIISMPAFGLQFSLKDDKNNMPGSSVLEAPQKVAQTKLCKMISEGGWTLEREEDMTAPYAYKQKNWISFDDATSASIKGKYVLLRNLGGISVTSSEDDDWAHTCPGRPLVDTLHHTLTNLARKSRAAQLLSLQDQIHNSLLSSYSGDVQLSPFRIVRVVDRAGSVHVVRKEAKTEFQCSRQGYFTHPSGCNRFYRCVKFNQYSSDFTVFEYDCPAGLAFDERYEVCVWPGSLPDASACKGSSEIAPVPRSRFACTQEGYYADPENCRWFFACLDHQKDGKTPPTAYEFRCPFGLVFDNEKLACDWPWKVAGCGSGQAAYATVASGTIYPGDILEGRLRPSYAQVSDAHVSGGRIPNVEGGLVLGTSLLKGIASQGSGAYGPGSSTYHGNAYGSGNLGAAAYGGADDNSGAYVHDPTGDTGGDYVHQDGGQVPYIHQDGSQVPYLHQSDSGSYRGDGNGGAYRGNGNSGSYKGYSDNGAYKGYSDGGAYKGSDSSSYQGSSGSGAYHSGGAALSSGSQLSTGAALSSGGYVHDTRGDSGGDYVHQDGAQVPYVHQDGSQVPYVHQTDNGAYRGDGDNGAYKGYSDGGAYKGSGSYQGSSGSGAYQSGGAALSSGSQLSTGAALSSGGYVHDTRGDSGGDYLHQDGAQVPYVHQDGSQVSYVHQTDNGAYRGDGDNGAYKGYSDGGAYKGSGSYQGSSGSGAYQSGGAALSSGSQLSTGAALSSGGYVHDTRGDAGGDYVHQDGAQVPYVHQDGAQVAYVHQTDNGAYRGNGDNGAYKGSGSYNYQGSSGSGAYVQSGGAALSSGSLVSSGAGSSSGAYVHDTRGDSGGAHIQDGSAYKHVSGASGSGATYTGTGGAYVQTGTLTGASGSGATYSTGTGGAYVQTGTLTGLKTGPIGISSGAYNLASAYNDVKTGGVGSGYIGSQGYVSGVKSSGLYSSDHTGAYVHDTRGDSGGDYVHQDGAQVPYIHQDGAQVPYVHQTDSGAYKHQGDSGSYNYQGAYHYQGDNGAYNHVGDNGAYLGSVAGYYGGKYKVGQGAYNGKTNLYQGANVYGSGAYVHDTRGDYGGGYQQNGYKTYGINVYQQPSVYQLHGIGSSKLGVQSVGYVQPAVRVQPITVTAAPVVPLKPVQYIQPAVRPVVVTTPAPQVVSYEYRKPVAVQGITVSSTPAVPLSPVQYVQKVTPVVHQTIHPVVVSTPAPPVVSYGYKTPVSTVSLPKVQPIAVASTPIVPLNPVQYVTTPAPSVHVQTQHLTPVQGYYQKPSVRLETPVTYHEPIQNVYVSTPAPPTYIQAQKIQPVVGYSYSKPVQPVSYVSTPAPPTVVQTHHVQPVSQVVYSTPAPTYVSSTVRPITVSSTPIVPLNPVQYNVPCTTCAVSQTARPLTVTATPIKPVQPSYTYTYSQQPPVQPSYTYTYSQQQPTYTQQQPICTSCAKAQTARPITVTSAPAIPFNPVQYSTPAPAIGYAYPKPAVRFETPIVQQTYTYKQPVQQISVSTPAPPVVNYYQKPVQPVVYSTPAPTYVSSTVRPIVSSTPVVPYNPVQYVKFSTPAPQVVGYSYPQPAVKFETPVVQQTYAYRQPVQQISVSTPAPPVVSYTYQKPVQPVVYSTPVVSTTVRPIAVSRTPVIPLNPVQYQPAQVSYSYPKPAVRLETPVVQQTYTYRQPVQQISVSTPAPPVVSYTYQKPVQPVVSYSYQKPVQPVVYSTPQIYSTTARPITVSSTPVVPLNPVQYQVSTAAPPVISYTYQRPVVKTQPIQQVSVTPVVQYQQPIYKVTTPSPPVVVQKVQPAVGYSYPKPAVKFETPVQPAYVSYNQEVATHPPAVISYQPVRTQTVRPFISVSSTPAVPLNPVQYVKPVESRPIVDYSYVQQTPIIRPVAVSTPAPTVVKYQQQYVQQVVTTPAPPVVKYQQQYEQQYVRVSTPAPQVVRYTPSPFTVSSTPVVPYNPVQYVKPAPPKPVVSYNYNYVQPTPAPAVVSYQPVKVATPAPAVVSYTPIKTVTQAPVVNYTPIKTVTQAPPAINYEYNYNYQPIRTQTLKPYISVTTTPEPQYVAPVKTVESKPVFNYNYVKPQPFAIPSQAPEVVEYNVQEPSKPIFSYNYVRPTTTYVQTPAPVVQTYRVTTPRPAITVTSAPAVPLAPVQYVQPAPAKPIFNYNYVRPTTTYIETPAPVYQTYRVTTPRPAVTVTSTPAVPLAPVQYVQPAPAKPIYNYNYVRPTTTYVETSAPVVQTYRVTTPRPAIAVISTPTVPLAPVQYEQPAKPIYNYNYVKPTTTYVQTTTEQPFIEYKPIRVRPAIQKVAALPVVPVTTQQPVEYTNVRVKTPVVVTTEQPLGVSVYEEYFDAKKTGGYEYKQPVVQLKEERIPVRTNIVGSGYQQTGGYEYRQPVVQIKEERIPVRTNIVGSGYGYQQTGGYEYKQPVVQLKEERIPVRTNIVGSGYGYEQTYSSSFSPIVVPEISTVAPARKRPVHTYVNTVEEESYYSAGHDENLNIHLDIPRVGVQQVISSTTPEQVVQVTTVAPVGQRVRVNGGNSGGYVVRKQKVRVRPVVTTTENYPSFYTTTVKPVYSSTIDLTSPTFYTTTVRPTYYTTTVRPTYSTTYKSTSTTADDEVDVEDGEAEDDRLIQQVSGGFGSVLTSGDSGLIRQGSVSSTTVSSLKDGEAIVGYVKKGERNQITGRRRTKVVVVSRLSEFNPLLVGKLGAECSCKSDSKTLDLTTTRTRGKLFRPVTTTTTVAEPSRDYLPTSSTPLPDELTNVDYDDALPPARTVEIKPVRKVQRVYTTTGAPLDISTVEYESSTRPARKIASGSGSGSGSHKRLDADVDCQRPGLFRHPHLCNKFYSCNWDEWKKRYTVAVFNCPIHLAFDSKLGACNWPSKGPACAENNLLV